MTDLAVIVASRVKAEIFRLLFGLRRPELHLREIVRQSGLSLGTVQQELKGLTSVGLLKSRRDGNRVYFSANPDHPAHRELSALVLKTDGLVGVLGKALTGPEVQLAFVFGSIARGEDPRRERRGPDGDWFHWASRADPTAVRSGRGGRPGNQSAHPDAGGIPRTKTEQGSLCHVGARRPDALREGNRA